MNLTFYYSRSDTESAEGGHLSRTREEARPAEPLSSTPQRPSKESPMARALALPRSINFKALLPGGAKNKDKVAQSEDKVENKADDEAKPLQGKQEPTEQGLVYAELALRPNADQENKPATPDKTEYAEIVYNQQPVENKMEPKDNK